MTDLQDVPRSDAPQRRFTEPTVVARAQDGDMEAFSELVRTYEAPLYRLAYRMLYDHGEAEDVVQDAFILAWRRLPTLEEPKAFQSWLYHLASRRCLNVIRARSRRPADLVRGEDFEAEVPPVPTGSSDSPAAVAEASALREGLEQALRDLPAESRICWVLKELHHLSYPEIATILEIPISTVRGRIARARLQLAKGLTSWK